MAQDERVLWANERMERLLPSGVRLGAPLVQSVRDPEILASVQSALSTRDVTVARAGQNFLRSHFRCDRGCPCPAVVPSRCCMIRPTSNGWKRRGAILSPTSHTSYAPR